MVFQELAPWRRSRSTVRPGQDDFTLGSLQRRVNRMFDDFFSDFEQPAAAQMEFMPRIDVSETDNEIKVTAELAGIDEKDVEVTVNDDVLTIKGEKKDRRDEKNQRMFLSERSYGSFSRSIALPESIQQDKISAVFKQGILTLTLPKAPAQEPRAKKIEIKTA
ncbi:MAG: Hsp20/alpha crystallin family protein [Planctomycetaceae bacterium]|nr:Hsp20/alpha crystallin family protein [Planctomycetaceae bacterium]